MFVWAEGHEDDDCGRSGEYWRGKPPVSMAITLNHVCVCVCVCVCVWLSLKHIMTS